MAYLFFWEERLFILCGRWTSFYCVFLFLIKINERKRRYEEMQKERVERVMESVVIHQ
jgi:hypothetical protein